MASDDWCRWLHVFVCTSCIITITITITVTTAIATTTTITVAIATITIIITTITSVSRSFLCFPSAPLFFFAMVFFSAFSRALTIASTTRTPAGDRSVGHVGSVISITSP